MAKYSVAIPEIFDGELRVGSCSVCSIENIIGANEDECTLHFSHPGVEYNYGYDYITATDEFIWGYYIGIDRFYEIDGTLGKEYILYELGVFQEDESERVASLLYSHLIRLASDRGCQRIICSPCGGNEEFYALLEKGGFKRNGELLSLRLDGVKMCPQDEVVLPRVGEALRFEDLFFLREAGFSVDQKKCKFENEVGSITVNRRDGICQFSNRISVKGGELILNNEWALTVIDVLCQVMKCRMQEDVKIYLPYAKENEHSPDIVIGDAGVYITPKRPSLEEERAIKATLRLGGVLKKYSFYTFGYDYETGGDRLCIGFANL